MPDMENLIFLSLGNCPAIWEEVYLNLDRMILANLAIFFRVVSPTVKIESTAISGSHSSKCLGMSFFRSSEKYGYLNT